MEEKPFLRGKRMIGPRQRRPFRELKAPHKIDSQNKVLHASGRGGIKPRPEDPSRGSGPEMPGPFQLPGMTPGGESAGRQLDTRRSRMRKSLFPGRRRCGLRAGGCLERFVRC